LFIIADKARARGGDVKWCTCAGVVRDTELKLEDGEASDRIGGAREGDTEGEERRGL
jgi:hypothetical protein